MSRFFRALRHKPAEYEAGSSAPPQWVPAPEPSVSPYPFPSLTLAHLSLQHKWGKWNEAPEEEFDAAVEFCREYPVQPPRLLPSEAVDRINEVGCRAWGIDYPASPRFAGHILSDSKGGPAVVTIQTQPECKDVSLLSNLPIIAGLYDIQGKEGVYYEILINRMDGIIAIGMLHCADLLETFSQREVLLYR